MPVVQHTAALRGLRPVANALGAGGVADVQPGHRLARRGGQLAHDLVHHRRLHLVDRLGVHRPQRQLVAVEVHVGVHADGEQNGQEQDVPARNSAPMNTISAENPDQQQERLQPCSRADARSSASFSMKLGKSSLI